MYYKFMSKFDDNLRQKLMSDDHHNVLDCDDRLTSVSCLRLMLDCDDRLTSVSCIKLIC